MSIVFQWKPGDMDALLAECERNEILPFAQRHFPTGGSVLEAGCGVGQWVHYLSARGFRATGVEISSETIAMALKYWPALDLRVGDAEHTLFADDTFDAVLSLGVVEHWPQGPQGPLREIHRVLKRGGVALITVPCQNKVRQWKKWLWVDEAYMAIRAARNYLVRRQPTGLTCFRFNRQFRYRVFPAIGTFFEYRLRPEEFRREVEAAGFEIVEHAPVATMDGVFHELNPFGRLIRFQDWTFYPTRAGGALHRCLTARPFAACHMQLIIARK